ncbi:MAG: diguanylate cyclase, partial [Campylobacteraceae bacterium]|nr:diguanylate cyclase [Campylobacteraceae bacterium]
VTMPKMDGIEMTRKIKEIDSYIPIIILSAHNDATYLLEAIELGVSGYLLKPVDRDKMSTQLETYARTVCLDKINKRQQAQIIEQQTILQNIIDVDTNINFVTNFDSISFANSSFLRFFDVESIASFQKKYSNIESVFMEHEDYVYPSMIGLCDRNSDKTCFGELFFKRLQSIDESKRVVLMLDKSMEPKSFFINISVIDADKHIYLISLTDITKMTIEKVNIEQKAYYDGLTGVYNRNKLNEFFAQELLRVERYKRNLSVAIIDIDHFKNFNDTYGHLVGDEVLIMMAQKVEQKVRKTDMFARWGGEEFVIVFVETKLEDAVATSNNIREHIEKLSHKTAGGVTASFGLTQYKDGDTLETLFKRCDDALYVAKENGRNRVEVKY